MNTNTNENTNLNLKYKRPEPTISGSKQRVGEKLNILETAKKVSRMKIVADKLIGPSGSEMILCWL